MRTIKRIALIIAIVWALLLGVGVTLVASTAQLPVEPTVSAPAIKGACTTVWLTHPSYYDQLNSGTKRCVTLKSTGWVKVYRTNGTLLDYISPHLVTRVAPHNGDGSRTATIIKGLATKYKVKLQFARVDIAGRPGCTRTGFHSSVSGAYQSAPSKPGKGLIRLGTGKYKSCIGKHHRTNIDMAKHEISHGVMERKCEGRNIYREEHTTDAYAWYYLKSFSKSPGNYGFNSKDLWRAKQVYLGKC